MCAAFDIQHCPAADHDVCRRTAGKNVVVTSIMKDHVIYGAAVHDKGLGVSAEFNSIRGSAAVNINYP